MPNLPLVLSSHQNPTITLRRFPLIFSLYSHKPQKRKHMCIHVRFLLHCHLPSPKWKKTNWGFCPPLTPLRFSSFSYLKHGHTHQKSLLCFCFFFIRFKWRRKRWHARWGATFKAEFVCFLFSFICIFFSVQIQSSPLLWFKEIWNREE